MFIYESHMGGLYVTDEILDYEECIAVCGDSDTYIGTANDSKGAWNLLKELTNIDGSGGYNKKFIENFIKENFETEESEENNL